jgi:4-hydroxy-3-polyprenylbenzoate decarboxylase
VTILPKLVVGISGASGIIYGLRLLDYLSKLKDYETYVILSKNAVKVAVHECCSKESLVKIIKSRCRELYVSNDLNSPLSSTSFIYNFDSMTIIPCSLKTLAMIANSIQGNLLSRAALNFLRLRKPLVLVIRETPISTIDIINMFKASLSGATILPASPAFYPNPKNLSDVVDYVVGKVLDVLGIENKLYRRWGDGRTTQDKYLCVQFFGQECL